MKRQEGAEGSEDKTCAPDFVCGRRNRWHGRAGGGGRAWMLTGTRVELFGWVSFLCGAQLSGSDTLCKRPDKPVGATRLRWIKFLPLQLAF